MKGGQDPQWGWRRGPVWQNRKGRIALGTDSPVRQGNPADRGKRPKGRGKGGIDGLHEELGRP